tara:strand:- start:200 stop:571 length:372 start_codon:yes stop_codon:yes gene_type:complete
MKNILYLFLAVTIIACSSGGDNNPEDFNPNSELIGEWNAVYNGDENGTAELVVSSSGVISGFTDEGSVSGTVSNSGNLSATSGNVDTGYDTTFTGTLQTNGTGSGSWSSSLSGYTGSWTATKQ